MLLLTEYSVLTVRMVWHHQRKELLNNLIIIACKAHIILLIHGLQLSMEATDNGVFEALRLNLSPILNLV